MKKKMHSRQQRICRNLTRLMTGSRRSHRSCHSEWLKLPVSTFRKSISSREKNCLWYPWAGGQNWSVGQIDVCVVLFSLMPPVSLMSGYRYAMFRSWEADLQIKVFWTLSCMLVWSFIRVYVLTQLNLPVLAIFSTVPGTGKRVWKCQETLADFLYIREMFSMNSFLRKGKKKQQHKQKNRLKHVLDVIFSPYS